MNKKNLIYGSSPFCDPSDRHVEDADGNTVDSDYVDKVGEQLNQYLTRRQAAEYIRDILGRPFSFSTASKLAALGEFAQPALWWGRRPLYTRNDLRNWAEARSRLTKERA